MTTLQRAALAAGVRLGLAPSFTPRRWRRYLDSGGRLVEAAGAGPGLLARRLRMGLGEARKLAREIKGCDPESEIEEAARAGVEIVAWGQPGYPCAFGALADPPPVLYLRGSLGSDDGVAAAIVGSRRATEYGLRVARVLGGDLARAGVTVVAGLARGIDAAAHRGALEAGGRTLAVLGSGLLEPYPSEHVGLIENIVASGAVVSEFPLRMPPRPTHFPQRNRLVAALSLAVVVVEAAERSGALSTARHALDLGREVVAVPGPVDSPVSQGTLRLLQEGAAPIGSAQDLFHALGWCDAGPTDLPGEERRVLDVLAEGGATAEAVAREAKMPEEVAAGHLLALEVRGLVVRTEDGMFFAR